MLFVIKVEKEIQEVAQAVGSIDVLAGLLGLTQFVVAKPGFISFAAYFNPDGTMGNFWGMMGVMVLAVAIAFVVTYLLGKKQTAKN